MNQRNQIDSNIYLPETWAGWHLTGVLGQGAYGTVYRAEDESGHVAAIKIIRLPEGAEVPETELLPLLKDLPGVVRVEDYCIQKSQGRSEGVLRMEYLTDLPRWGRTHDWKEEEAIDWMIQLCQTLAGCEKQGIIHRDIKPGNILIDEAEQVKLGDFGVARVASQTDSHMSLAGTFRYMAPEVYHGEAYDHRADIYSLGMVFYELMNAGKIPFEEEGREQALRQRMSGKHFLRPTEASKGFSDILLKACAYNPEARYQNAEELKRDLESLKRGDPRQSNRKKYLVAVAVMVTVIGLAIVAGLWASRPIVPRESCGNGVSWILRRNGTLELSGKGKMDSLQTESFTNQHRKMLSHFDRIKKLVVKENVRYIDFCGVELPNLEEVVFSEGLDHISPNCFADKMNLRSVIFQGKDVDLGDYVFSGCSKLSDVVLPSELARIPEGCFLECTGLKELTIPDTVKEIESFAFSDTPWYTSRYDSEDLLIVGDQVLVFWKGPEEELSITREMGISHIGGSAFFESPIKRIRMDDSVLSIGNCAFMGTSLESATLPRHLSVIPDHAFSSCRNLKNIVLPDSLTRIGEQAFWGCSSLKKMSLPPTLESVGWQAFDETPFKKMHTDQAGFTVISDFLVDYQGNDTDLVIPDTLGIIRTSDYCMTQNQRIRSLTLPEGLRVIGDCSFFMCPKLETVFFPKSLEKIGQGAFEDTPWERK